MKAHKDVFSVMIRLAVIITLPVVFMFCTLPPNSVYA